jgi:hypothetical protein
MAGIVTAPGRNRKKLYYTFSAALPTQQSAPVAVTFAGGVSLSLTQGFAAPVFAAPGSTPDDYGNLIDDDPSPADAVEAIGGWVDEHMADAVAAATFPTFLVQFWDATAAVAPAFGVKSIDPASVKHPAVTVWVLPTVAPLSTGNVTGRLLIQRQHSIEV